MKKLKAFLLALALVSAGAYAGDSLVGTWKSTTAKNGALQGTLELRKDSTVTLKANDQPAFSGSWSVPKAGVLAIAIPDVGESEMAYKVKASKLVLTYDNGNSQEFVRKAVKPGKGKTK